MFLHAWRLQFNHPATGERIELMRRCRRNLQDFVPINDHATAPASLT
jgi:23S rRNA pseudouridine955/2504/2580 synthase